MDLSPAQRPSLTSRWAMTLAYLPAASTMKMIGRLTPCGMRLTSTWMSDAANAARRVSAWSWTSSALPTPRSRSSFRT